MGCCPGSLAGTTRAAVWQDSPHAKANLQPAEPTPASQCSLEEERMPGSGYSQYQAFAAASLSFVLG